MNGLLKLLMPTVVFVSMYTISSSRVLAKTPKSLGGSEPGYLYVKAQEKFSLLKFDEAISLLQRARSLSSKPGQRKLIELSLLTVSKVAGKDLVLDDPHAAIRYMSLGLSIVPDDYFLLERRGKAYCKLLQASLCIEDHNRALTLNPNKGYGYWSRGSAYFTLKQYDLAFVDFEKSVAAYRGVGDTKNAELYEEVMQTFKAAVEFR